jgi:hypothetical protein
MSPAEIMRSLMDGISPNGRRVLNEAHTSRECDTWLENNGWEERGGIALWMKPGDDRWMIDTNAESVVMLYDELNGYGEPLEYYDHPQEAVQYIENDLKSFPDGKQTVISHYDGDPGPDGKHGKYLQPDGSWSFDSSTATRFSRKDAADKIKEIDTEHHGVFPSAYHDVSLKHLSSF